MLNLLLLLLAVPVASAGPGTPVAAVAYSPDGQLLAAAGRGEIHLLDAASGEPVDRLDGLEAKVTALAFSPDGKLLAAAAGKPGQSGFIHLFQRQPSAWAKLGALSGHADLIHALAFRPDGKVLASAGYERIIHVWDLSTRKLARTLADHSDSIHALAFSPSGRLLASGSADRAVKLWDVDSGQRRQSLGHATDWVYALAFSPDGNRLASAGVDRSIRIYALEEEPRLLRTTLAHAAPVLRLLWLSDGKTLFSMGEDRLLKRWAAETLAEQSGTPPLPEAALSLAVSPDGQTLAVGLYDGRLELLDAKTGLSKATPLPARYPLARLPLERFSQPVPLAIPATVVGTLVRPGADLRFLLELQPGQELGVQLQRPAGSQLDPELQLLDAKGNLLAEDRAGLLGYRCEQSGKYLLLLRDRLYRGSAGYTFRLKVGPLPIVLSHHPLGLRQGTQATVRLEGVNLGPAKAAVVNIASDAKPGSRVRVSLPTTPEGPVLNPPSLLVGEFPQVDLRPEVAGAFTALSVPGTGEGYAEPDFYWTFPAKAGQPILMEVHASRLGSPLDSVLEVLNAEGEPLPRALLRATTTAYTTLRDHDASTGAIRFEAMNGIAMGDWVWLGGELLKIEEMPRNPDDDCRFHSRGGRRVGWLGTTPRAHGLGSIAYRVEVHPPSTRLSASGLPTFPVFWENDNGGAGYGTDSYLAFEPPADGVYRLRIRDALGRVGPVYAYRVTLRPPRPDFSVTFEPRVLAVPAGESRVLYLSAARKDEFTGRIDLEVAGLPDGWRCLPSFIGEGVNATAMVVTAPPTPPGWWWHKPPVPKPARLISRATIGGKVVVHERSLPLNFAFPGSVAARTEESTVELLPGGTANITIAIDRRGHKKRVPVEVRGLPYGVRVTDVGLNGVLITEAESQRTFSLYAEPWVAPQEKPLAVIAKPEGSGESAAPAVLLRVTSVSKSASRKEE